VNESSVEFTTVPQQSLEVSFSYQTMILLLFYYFEYYIHRGQRFAQVRDHTFSASCHTMTPVVAFHLVNSNDLRPNGLLL